MTFYEELGISADAAEEDIRQAHRRLVKLLHPDQQSNDELRRLAELQLMRVNSIVEQLLDPTQRKLYDLALRAPAPAPQTVSRDAVPQELIDRWWKYATAGVALAFVAWVFTSASPTDVVRTVAGGVTSVAASETVPPKPKSAPPPSVARNLPYALPTRVADPPQHMQSTDLREIPVSPGAARIVETPPHPAPAHEPSPPIAKAPTDTASPTLSGIWLYAGGKRTAEDERLYKPEYIELRIREENGVLYGEYRSRYAVTDLPISPAVNFSFEGATGLAALPWKGPKGSNGTVVLKLLNKNAMQVDWKLADAGESGIGLEFGTAILLRRL